MTKSTIEAAGAAAVVGVLQVSGSLLQSDWSYLTTVWSEGTDHATTFSGRTGQDGGVAKPSQTTIREVAALHQVLPLAGWKCPPTPCPA